MTTDTQISDSWLNEVAFNSDGLIPAIAQDAATGRVLMVAWMNRESLALTAQKKQAVYFSRSRGKLWHKGETSGHVQEVHEIRLDCDADVVCLQVTQHSGIACHTGRQSCFYRKLENGKWVTTDDVLKSPDKIYGKSVAADSAKASIDDDSQSNQNHNTNVLKHSQDVLTALGSILSSRKTADASSSYVASLYHKGINKILEKVGEECTETLIAAKDFQNAQDDRGKKELVYEVADLWFHTLVMLSHFDIEPHAITDELARRFDVSGIAEKAARSQ